MPNLVRSAAFHLVTAMAVTLSLLLTPSGTSAAHNPAALAAAASVDHGHVRDDDMEDERSPGHDHGAHSADHSHETPDIVQTAKPPIPPIGGGWHPNPSDIADIVGIFRLERPPRPPSPPVCALSIAVSVINNDRNFSCKAPSIGGCDARSWRAADSPFLFWPPY